MGGIDLITMIRDGRPAFSKSQRLIGDFILEHYDKAAYMTAQKLGTAVGVSESTVVRFAVELGFEGYPEMQKDLQSLIKNRLTSLQRIDITNDRIEHENILRSVLNQDIARIKATSDQADEKQFIEAVEHLTRQSGKIYVFGAMGSAMLANFLASSLSLIYDNIVSLAPQSESGVYQQMMRIGSGDTLMVISFPRYCKTAVKAAQFAKNQGANIIALTDADSSPLAPLANQLLIAKSDMAGFVDSLVAPLSVVNALITAVTIVQRDAAADALARLEVIWDTNNVYDKDA
jgi:DNA-binding MurR/RpiR family transcriptional regulator